MPRSAHARGARDGAVRLSVGADPSDSIVVRRQVLADFCKLVGTRVRSPIVGNGSSALPSVAWQEARTAAPLPHLSPRMQQTLHHILQGDGEKQIGAKLGVSKHTVHVYIKALYRGFDVNSRSELMSKFVGNEKMPAIDAPSREPHTFNSARSAG